MALHRSTATLAAAALIVVAGCDNLSFRRLDFDATETVEITTVRVLPGSGDVVVRATGPAGSVRVKRVMRYQGAQPETTYRIDDAELVLDTGCGPRCSLSYEVVAPPGVAVQGKTGSGNVDVTRTGAVDLKVGSGDVRVAGAGGPVRVETGSGDIEVVDVATPVTLRASSGDITARRIGAVVDAETSSGQVTVELATPASVRAHSSSGDVELVVPAGSYQVRSEIGSGRAELDVPDTPTATLMLDVATGSGNQRISQR
ncbi:DUF4097 family beta strand repeat-containing protein [Micromonospora sp. WMMA1363]|uniref:DUF4097 family beta strand repeat-containing protein n=1 Tax=Micromonospora sp. WMMA1363 TaxID=3053985 RepID=UPI00259CC03C|nr:DUF4097 family beta strand repeat-containing protein [Micromonospora sp. WMMA1363]MDM4720282.1 DUF4097 family beta strand repeat-containing protein [Micromonospora sp. WMMA1363]